MADKPEAPAEAPKAPESEANQPTNNPEPPKAPETSTVDMHGFTSEQLAEMKKFYDANGGFDKVKAKISNPSPEQKPEAPAQTQPEAPQAPQAPEQPQAPAQPVAPPQGAVTQREMMDQYYFEQLSKQEKYAPIAKEIANGSLLKEMAALGIDIHNQDGSYNDAKINTYLGIKAQTVPAQQTTEPVGSPAPTVNYIPVGEEIKDMNEARAVFMQAGHPARQKAIDFIRKSIGQEPKDPNKK